MALTKLLYFIPIVIIMFGIINCDLEYGFDHNQELIKMEDSDYNYFGLYYKDFKYFEIDCLSVNNINLSISEMNFTDMSTVKFRRCPLSVIRSGISRMGIKEIGGLKLAIVQNTSSNSLERQHLPDHLFNDLRNLTLLVLNNNHVHLSLNIFKPLQNMEILELANNSLEFLEPGIFKYQKNLKLLELSGNKLQNLTKESFSGAESLEVISLSACNIKTFVPDIFSNLINLKNINLNLNNFTSLPGELFVNNKKLEEFELSDNHGNLTTLPNRMLANLPILQRIIISARLDTIPKDLFVRSREIWVLDLCRNKFKILPTDIFHDLENLYDLDLCNNELMQLKDSLFNSTVALKKLRLSHNNLTFLSSSVFKHLTHLKYLYLDNNKLHTINSKVFHGLQYLYELELNNNELTFENVYDNWNFHSPFSNLTKLGELNLSTNKIHNFDVNIFLPNKRLDTIDLSYNNISYITATYLHNVIKEIDLYDEIIPPFDTPLSININLNYNPINCNCRIYNFIKYIKNNKNIKYLLRFGMDKLYCNKPENMINRQIETIEPKEFFCLLNSPNTNKTLCPTECICQMQPYFKTLILNCSYANLYDVPQVPILPEIKFIEFHLDNNNLIALPSIHNNTNSGYKLVTTLNLANNKLKNIEPENIPNNLTLLDLTNNQLTSMNPSFINKLENLYLSGNPWICDCTTISFLIFCESQKQIIKDYSMIQCANDGTYLKDKRITELCSQSVTLTIILSSIALIGLLIGLMTAFYYKYKMEIKIWLFDKKLFTRWVNEYDVDVDMIYDAFVSYSHLDQDFVTKYILPELEQGTPKYKLCLHERDWKIGNTITQSIADSVAHSRRTIIILSSNFLDSDWAKFEFRVAYEKSMAEKRSRLIVIIYGEEEIDKNKLDNELKAYLNTNTYIKWGDEWFWKRLRYALPHQNGHRLQSPNGLLQSQLEGATEELELVSPITILPPE